MRKYRGYAVAPLTPQPWGESMLIAPQTCPEFIEGIGGLGYWIALFGKLFPSAKLLRSHL